MRIRTSIGLLATAAAATGLAVAGAPARAAGPGPGPTFLAAQTLPGAADRTEPRVTVAPDGSLYVITNAGPAAVVYRSRDDGRTWQRTATDPAHLQATIDTDIVATRTGRLIASELDDAGITFMTSYSDDGGATWTKSSGMLPADTDRQWLAVGPDDPTTHLPRVYNLFHNLLTGAASHNMFVQTSTDNGASFGPPVPVTLPGDQAWADLQCADSGGPSSIGVNQVTGQIYVVFGTRSGPVAGGCTASVTGTFEINVVAATRVWVATSPTGAPGTWHQSLAVDDSARQLVVGMQLAPGALDRAGNVYVAYPESRSPTDYAAAIKYVHAPPDLSSWSAPVTVAETGTAGNVLPHIVAGDPGRLDFAYFTAVASGNGKPRWYSMVTQTQNGLDGSPVFSRVQLSTVPTYQATANELMGDCGSGTTRGVQDGFACTRSTDVYGLTLDRRGYLTVTWPTSTQAKTSIGAAASEAVPGTFVATQNGGPSLFADAASAGGATSTSASSGSTAVLGASRTRSLPATGSRLPVAVAFLSAAMAAALRTVTRRRSPSPR